LSTPFTISGLANENFTLFLYAFSSVNSANDRGEIFTVGSSTFNSATGNASSLDLAHVVDGFITGVTDSNGTISGTWAFDPSNHAGEIDWSGFQLDVSSAVAAPEPGTIVLLAGGLGLMILGRRRIKKENFYV
jgi:PEP-CTERM motif-containing protein